mgnify:FL=1|tara:strand:- start:4194 stop:4763 length:570 start_codon:yes stop_codon:yes gene_type:complete
MSKILYYSNFCDNSKKLLQTLAKCQEKKDIHFICIDSRSQKNNKTYIILSNGQEILLPPQVNRVPALLLLNQKDQNIIFGEDIANSIKVTENLFVSNKPEVIKNNEDPMAFSFSGGMSGVVSDNYSFWDQDSDQLSAKGDGGMRQLYSYSTINQSDSINTPEEDYEPDKIGNVSLEKLQQERNESIQKY